MAEVFGSGSFRYEHVDGWPNIPGDITLLECPGVGIDSKDNVFLLTRGKDPIVVFDKEGNF